ncbi:MAG TPA: glycerol-3-phosphate dehydrogenase [Pyrinomonadaceae bacterium]|nr:glycerol-3-phosphate dehydrogenase [Pyrinomonadaceae bacterium]
MVCDFDVIVVGAGINGAGIARDAAMRGLKVLLIDKSDVGGGTSAGSTRLIHGGLRYLEHFEFGLVRESLRERETLLRIAPHLVRPLPITIPIYNRGERGRATIRAGMIAYDLLSWGKTLPKHRIQSAAETLREMPGLNREGLLGSAVYFDAQVEFAERLVVENVLAAVECGATVRTYSRVVELLIEGGAVREVILEGNFRNTVRANVVINAAGPWVDRLLDFSEQESKPLIGGTKGSHVVVAPFEGAPARAVYLEAVSDQRPFFVIPWNGNYLIGTTDVRFEGNPDHVCCEPWEIDYLLNETNRAFPVAGLTRENVLYTYSGVRPLPFTTKDDEQSITRRHFIREHPQASNLISIVGGKLTTYRGLAEDCVDLVCRKLGRRFTRIDTAHFPLPGAVDFSSLVREFREFTEPVHDRLLRVYGARAAEVAELAKRNDELAKPFNKAQNALAAEIIFVFEREFATTLADCFLRRTMLGLNADLGLNDIDAAASICKSWLGWSDERAREEIESYRSAVSKFTPCDGYAT